MADQTPQLARPSRLWRIVLVVSLALNLAVAGLVVGAATSGRWKDGPPPNFEVGLGPIGRALAPDERRDIRRSLIRDRVLRDLNLRGGINDIVDALAAEPFDEARLRQLLDEQGERTISLLGSIQNAFLGVIAQMTPERRAEFAREVAEQAVRNRRDSNDPPSGG